jgi:hypothetical protein
MGATNCDARRLVTETKQESVMQRREVRYAHEHVATNPQDARNLMQYLEQFLAVLKHLIDNDYIHRR